MHSTNLHCQMVKTAIIASLSCKRMTLLLRITCQMGLMLTWHWPGCPLRDQCCPWGCRNYCFVGGRHAMTPGSLRATSCHDQGRCRGWWRHYMDTLSAFLLRCAWHPLVTGGFSAQRASKAEFDDFCLCMLLNKVSSSLWKETLMWCTPWSTTTMS